MSFFTVRGAELNTSATVQGSGPQPEFQRAESILNFFHCEAQDGLTAVRIVWGFISYLELKMQRKIPQVVLTHL